MTDAVIITIVGGITATINVIVGAIVTILTRRHTTALKTELEETVKKDGVETRLHVKTCCHPDDLPPPLPRPKLGESQRSIPGA